MEELILIVVGWVAAAVGVAAAAEIYRRLHARVLDAVAEHRSLEMSDRMERGAVAEVERHRDGVETAEC